MSPRKRKVLALAGLALCVATLGVLTLVPRLTPTSALSAAAAALDTPIMSPRGVTLDRGAASAIVKSAAAESSRFVAANLEPRLHENGSPVVGGPDPHRTPLIPHIIHQTWNTYDIPLELADWVKTWMTYNPLWEYWLWTPEEVRLLLREKYPDYSSIYDSYRFTIFRADAMRYFILDTFGGFYADMDMECLQPLDDWTYDHQCVLSHETYEHPYLLFNRTEPNVMTTIMASRPGHPFFQRCIQELKDTAKKFPMDVMRATGPWFIDDVFRQFTNVSSASAQEIARRPENNITVVPPKYFLPTFDPPGHEIKRLCESFTVGLVPHARQVCRELEKRNYKNAPFPESYTDHKWVHIFLKEALWRRKETVSIFELVPNVQIYGRGARKLL